MPADLLPLYHCYVDCINLIGQPLLHLEVARDLHESGKLAVEYA